MPRIRKKTSRRNTTAHRAKVQHKVAESRKKSKKAAKKDPTWKSKKPKDPGIPNNFPYKDQILAEIAAERRQAAEAKARRKEEKKNIRAQQKSGLEANGRGGDDDGTSGEDSDDAEGELGHLDGVATLGGVTGTRKSPFKSTEGPPTAVSGAAANNGAPPLLPNPDLPHLAAVLDKADVVIEVLDARDPLAHRSSALEAHVASKEGQKLLLVLNKIDTCPREPTIAWAAHLRSQHPTLLFRVASSFLPLVVTQEPTKGKGKSKEPSDDAWGLDAMSQLLGCWAQEKAGDEPLHVAIVGLANSGKSAFINSLVRKATLDVYAPSSSTNSPTTTPHALEVTLELNGKPIVLTDTPGLAWQPSEDENRERQRAQDVLLRNKGRIDRLKDPTSAVSYIISRAEAEDLMVIYGLPAFPKGDVDAFLMGIARAHGLIKKGGNPDLAAAARIVLRDWSIGKFSRYAVPPTGPSPGTAVNAVRPTLAAIYAGDAELLEKLTPRKELRRTGNLVRLSSERINDRALALETPWAGADDSDGEFENEGEVEMEAIGSGTDQQEEAATDEASSVESAESDALEDGSVSEEDDDDSDDDSDDEDEDGDGDEESPNTHSSSAPKRKRPPPSTTPKQQSDPARPPKKVAFAAEVVSSNKRTRNPPLLARRPVTAAHSKKQKTDVSRPSATTLSSRKANSGVRSMQHASAAGTPMRARKPAANAPMTQKRKQATSAAGEDDAYDFSKFF